jgi:DNA-binding response OmpR family regulator
MRCDFYPHPPCRNLVSARILIIEDEPDIVRILSDLLSGEGYQITAVSNATAGLAAITSQQPCDLILLDLMLPGMDGLTACLRLRASGFRGGILMLTALSQMIDRVQGLQLGADDYIVKPYHPDDLLARIAAILRRVQRSLEPQGRVVTFSGITADLASKTFTQPDGKLLPLSAKEAALLTYLIVHAGDVITRETLLAEIWPEQPSITSRTVDVHIAWLRKKIELNPANPRHILTDRGTGYRFVDR